MLLLMMLLLLLRLLLLIGMRLELGRRGLELERLSKLALKSGAVLPLRLRGSHVQAFCERRVALMLHDGHEGGARHACSWLPMV